MVWECWSASQVAELRRVKIKLQRAVTWNNIHGRPSGIVDYYVVHNIIACIPVYVHFTSLKHLDGARSWPEY
jgi:hypothetical protein